MIRKSDDKELVEEILLRLEENKVKYGERYCPCVLESQHDADHICMCKPFREQESGECHCGLFIKEGENGYGNA